MNTKLHEAIERLKSSVPPVLLTEGQAKAILQAISKPDGIEAILKLKEEVKQMSEMSVETEFDEGYVKAAKEISKLFKS